MQKLIIFGLTVFILSSCSFIRIPDHNSGANSENTVACVENEQRSLNCGGGMKKQQICKDGAWIDYGSCT